VLAAKGAGIKTVVIPDLNQRDLAEIPDTLTQGIEFKTVEHVREVLAIALRKTPSARRKKRKTVDSKSPSKKRPPRKKPARKNQSRKKQSRRKPART